MAYFSLIRHALSFAKNPDTFIIRTAIISFGRTTIRRRFYNSSGQDEQNDTVRLYLDKCIRPNLATIAQHRKSGASRANVSGCDDRISPVLLLW